MLIRPSQDRVIFQSDLSITLNGSPRLPQTREKRESLCVQLPTRKERFFFVKVSKNLI